MLTTEFLSRWHHLNDPRRNRKRTDGALPAPLLSIRHSLGGSADLDEALATAAHSSHQHRNILLRCFQFELQFVHGQENGLGDRNTESGSAAAIFQPQCFRFACPILTVYCY